MNKKLIKQIAIETYSNEIQGQGYKDIKDAAAAFKEVEKVLAEVCKKDSEKYRQILDCVSAYATAREKQGFLWGYAKAMISTQEMLEAAEKQKGKREV